MDELAYKSWQQQKASNNGSFEEQIWGEKRRKQRVAEIQDIFGISTQICDKKGEYNVPVIHIEDLLSVNYLRSVTTPYKHHSKAITMNNWVEQRITKWINWSFTEWE